MLSYECTIIKVLIQRSISFKTDTFIAKNKPHFQF